MQTETLFELVYIILGKKKVTAKEMAAHFCVSTRTIYRWVEALSVAGIPIYMTKGNGGGIFLSENYSLDKTILSDEEKFEIYSAVKAFHAVQNLENTEAKSVDKPINKALLKLCNFAENSIDWISVDFGSWSAPQNGRNTFELLKYGILHKKVVSFLYFSSAGESLEREVQPWQVAFRGQSWYLYGFCNLRKEPRYFKLNRIRQIKITQTNVTEFPKKNPKTEEIYTEKKLETIKLYFSSKALYRVLDEFNECSLQKDEKGGAFVTVEMQLDSWVDSWLLSFGSNIQVIEPLWLKEKLHNLRKEALESEM